ANHVGTTHIHQVGKSVAHAVTVSLSGGVVRNNLNMVLDAEYAEANMHGLYLLQGETQVDNHTIADHRKPNCLSNELYKGILDDYSSGVFNGKIFVQPDAQKTNAYQSNKNILLSNHASINTKPQLEIFADDVKCSHGCTTGQLDEDALFYLRSRGISNRTAKAMLTKAYVQDILNTVKIQALKTYLEGLIEQRFEQAVD
ncbi:MAG: SufD family Fe-S cluster assembly protein, partial [Cytophagales bacterium]|nr:SufD family Fe-S cluster assembly protein [Cytophagales bacterium]